MTQENLAAKINVTKGSIAHYENGVSVPKLEILMALMEALDVDANYVFGVNSTSEALMALTPHERQVILAYRRQKEMQQSVDRLLQIEPEVISAKNA